LAKGIGRKHRLALNGGANRVLFKVRNLILVSFSNLLVFLDGRHFWAFFSVALFGGPSEDVLSRFRNEAPHAWKLAESIDESPGTIKIITNILTYSGDQLTRTEEKSALLHRKAGFYLFDPLQSRDGGRTIIGKNPHYSFSITKEDDKDGSTLGELRIKGQKGFGEIPTDLLQYVKPNSYGFIPLQGNLSKLIESPSFKVQRAEEVNPPFVRVHFSKALSIPGQKAGLAGWMEFDPNNAWALKRSQCATTLGTSSQIVKTFSSSQQDGRRPCESWEMIQESTDGEKWKIKQQTQFEIIDTSSPPDEIFTLSHYGLPEPMGVKPLPTSRTWLWLLAAALAATGLALLFAWLKRRRTTASRVKTQVATRSR
jgi:hypothetical protein